MLTVNTVNMFRVIEVPPEITLDDSHFLIEKVNQLLEASNKPILLDCSQSENIDSQGIGAIVQAFKACRVKQVYYGILKPTSRFSGVLELTGLNRILNVLPGLPDMNSKEWDKAMGFADQNDLEFRYEAMDNQGEILARCKGIMHECVEFNRLLYLIEDSKEITLDFSELGFINISCLQRFSDTCKKSSVSITECNLIIEEAFKIFQCLENFHEVIVKVSSTSTA